MAAPSTLTNPSWSPGAWTPKRCKVWNLLTEEARAVFTLWVSAEGKQGSPYPSQLLPEHEVLLQGT